MDGNVAKERLVKLHYLMQLKNIDLVVFGPGPHTRWLLGFQPHADERPCLTCISQSSAAMLMPHLNADGCRSATDLKFFEWSDEQGPRKEFAKLLAELKVENAKSVVLDETMRSDFAFLVLNSIPNADYQFTEQSVGLLRLVKDDREYAILKENALIADRAMLKAWKSMKIGMTEREVAKVVRSEFGNQSSKPLFTIIGSGPNSSIPHHQTGDRKLEQGDVVVMDIGGSKDGYSSDITRMAIMGDPPEDYAEVHNVVNSAVAAAMEATRAGTPAKGVDAAARFVIASAGYGEYFIHRTGHGLGLEIHEPPYLTSTSETVLEPGMVFSIEPGIYIPGRFGIRLENIVILRDDGPEILSELPTEVKIIQ